MTDLKYSEDWYKAHDGVINTDCQMFHLHKGYDKRGERTVMIHRVTFDDGTQWHDVSERTGGDYRNDHVMLVETSRVIFERYIKTRR